MPSGLALVARTGSPAPGTPSGVNFSDLYLPTLNERRPDRVSRQSHWHGVNSTNNLGIWATDQTGALQLIARKGTQLEVAPGDFRTISDLDFVDRHRQQRRPGKRVQQLGPARLLGPLYRRHPGRVRLQPGGPPAGRFQQRRHRRRRRLRRVAPRNDGTQTGYDAWRANFGRTRFVGSGSSGLRQAALGRQCRADVSASSPPCLSVVMPAASSLANAELLLDQICDSRSELMKRLSASNHHVRRRSRSAGHVNRHSCSCHQYRAPACAGQSPRQGATIEFDASAKSPAVIPFDPDAIVEGRSGYVSGRIPTNVKGPVIGGTNINTLLGADAFYIGLYRHQRGHRQH